MFLDIRTEHLNASFSETEQSLPPSKHSSRTRASLDKRSLAKGQSMTPTILWEQMVQVDSSWLTWPEHTARLLTQVNFHLNHLTGLGNILGIHPDIFVCLNLTKLHQGCHALRSRSGTNKDKSSKASGHWSNMQCTNRRILGRLEHTASDLLCVLHILFLIVVRCSRCNVLRYHVLSLICCKHMHPGSMLLIVWSIYLRQHCALVDECK